MAILTFLFAGTPLAHLLPMPGTAAYITVAHVPVIVGAILGGPLVGVFLGALFGIFTYLDLGGDPVVMILPRLMCGLVASLVFLAARRHGQPGSQMTVGALAAAVGGTLTNTLGVTALAMTRGLLPANEAFSVILFHGATEVFLAAIVAVPVAVSRAR